MGRRKKRDTAFGELKMFGTTLSVILKTRFGTSKENLNECQDSIDSMDNLNSLIDTAVICQSVEDFES